MISSYCKSTHSFLVFCPGNPDCVWRLEAGALGVVLSVLCYGGVPRASGKIGRQFISLQILAEFCIVRNKLTCSKQKISLPAQ